MPSPPRAAAEPGGNGTLHRRIVGPLLVATLLLSSLAFLPLSGSSGPAPHLGTAPPASGTGSPSGKAPPSASGPSASPGRSREASLPAPLGEPRVPRPSLVGAAPPTTSINGSVDINGSLAASTTSLQGNVSIEGSATSSNYTATTGWANYGPTVVTGTMQVSSLPGSDQPIFATTPGSSLWVQPFPLNASGLNVLQGNLQFGNGPAGDAFDMTTNGVNITVDALQAGGFYSSPSTSANLEVANYSIIRNYANSSSSLTSTACESGICLPVTIAPGAVFLVASLACAFPLLGCIAAIPLESLTWTGAAHFTLLGSLGTTGSGMTATLPDSRLDIGVPSGYEVNISLTPASGTPSLSVTPGSTLPALVVTQGQVRVSAGEALNASVVVQGTFTAYGHVDNGGSFLNVGGLDLTGDIESEGQQVFAHKLEIGPQVDIRTYGGSGDVVAVGASDLNGVAALDGTLVAQGNLAIDGTLAQNATLSELTGTLSLNGTLSATGSIGTEGTTVFDGALSSAGDLALPNAAMEGSFSFTDGEFEGVGSTLLVGTSLARGWTWINSTTYAVVGSTWLNGSIDVNRSISVTGNSVLSTDPGTSLRLTATILMGTGDPGGPAWTSRVQGSVSVAGTSFANGTSTFGGSLVTFPTGLSVHGTVEADGNVSVNGTSYFSGAVTSSGVAEFPGMSLSGTFGLSATGGEVNATGTTDVAGNATLVGLLTVDHGVFSEVGTSSLSGDLTLTGIVDVVGDSTLTTASQTLLSLTGNIELANAAHIEGNVNTTGEVSISGSALLSAAAVDIEGSLVATGSVYTRGQVELTGRADFEGPLDTLGRTSLPGLSVAGNYSLHTGAFELQGDISLTGYTLSTGEIVANSTGYYVTGTSRIVGDTVANGTAQVSGSSTTVGFAELGDGATLGTYMVVNGGLSAGGIPLSGTVLLPNDTVTFPEGANISGTIWQAGVLSSNGVSMSFSGRSIVNGTVVSPDTPSLQGPIVADVFGASFALTLGPEFFVYVGGLFGVVGVAGLELFRLGWKYRRPFSAAQRTSLRRLWPQALAIPVLLACGGVLGAAAGYSLGPFLANPANSGSAGVVAQDLWIADVLLLAGFALWLFHRWQYARLRGAADAGPAPLAPTA